MKQSVEEMLRYHAEFGSTDEVRGICREMLAACGDAKPQTVHAAQTYMTSPTQRAEYLESLGRRSDQLYSDDPKEAGRDVIVILLAAAIAAVVFVAAIYLWWL